MRKLHLCALAALSLTSSFAVAQTKVLFLTRHRTTNPVTLKAADPQILTYLEQRYGAANVTWMSSRPDLLVPPEPMLTVDDPRFFGYDAIVISATIESGDLRGLIHETHAGIVNLEAALARNLGGEYQVVDPAGRYPISENENAHGIILQANHPITAGFQLNVPIPICGAAANIWWSESIAPGATNLATDDDTPANGFLTYVEMGDTLHNGNPATCRRVMFGMGNGTFANLNAAGQQLFGQAIDWAAANCCAQTGNYGTGLAGQLGIPTLTTSAPPVFGTSLDILASNSSGAPVQGVLLLGTDATSIPVLGGTLLTLPLSTLDLTIPANGLVVPVTLPMQGPAGACPSVYAQLFQLDPAAPNGISMTPGMRLKLGF